MFEKVNPLKNEKEALQMFCDENSERLYCREPITIDNKGKRMVMATEGHFMALVDAELLHSEYDVMMQRVPNFDYDRREFATVVEFSNIERAYNQFDLIPEKVTKYGKPKECPECNGSGEVEYEYTDRDGRTHYMDFDCPICCGAGERHDCELVETGRMILPENCTFALGKHIIDANYMWRVVTALRMMGFERMTWKSSQEGALIFDVCDGFVVVIAPRIAKGDSLVSIEVYEEEAPR